MQSDYLTLKEGESFQAAYLNPKQYEFMQCTHRRQLLLGGYRSGKTHALIMKSIYLLMRYPGCVLYYLMPTYGLLLRTVYPTFLDFFQTYGIRYREVKKIYAFFFENGSSMYLQTMVKPENLVGSGICFSVLDELDTLSKEHALRVYQKITARESQSVRDIKPMTMVGTTGEGYNGCWKIFMKEWDPSKKIIKMTTFQNIENLAEGYIDALEGTYSERQLRAYRDGEFVNMTSDQVYYTFDRKKSHIDKEIGNIQNLHIGMDFNVGKMSAVVFVIEGGLPYAVDEIVNKLDTSMMLQEIKYRYPGKQVTIYPDASGGARHSQDASASDFVIIRNEGFSYLSNRSNPRIKDRVMSVVSMLKNAKGERRLKVNTVKCPSLTEALEQQVYRDGVPDKANNYDHLCDAVGYFINYKYSAAITRRRGIRTF